MEEEEEGRQDLPAPPEEEAVRTVDQAEPNPVIHTAHESATQNEVVAAVEGSNHDDAGGVIDAEEVEVEIHPDASTALEADQTPPSSPPPIPPRPVDEIPLLDPTIPKRMYYCVVCMENETFGEQSFELTSSCQHVYCTDCLAGYLISKIIDGQVYPRCFVPKKIPKGGKSRPGSDNTSRIGSSSSGAANSSNASTLLIDEEKGSNEAEDTEDVPCNIPMLEADILKVLTPHTEAHEKYIRFKFCRENPQARECSHCHVFNIGDPANPKITCSHCQDVYCYNHSNAHDFMKYPTCEEYEAELKKEIQESEELIARESKPCPRCRIMIMKSGGCNHMRCQCGASFCWICGQEIDDDLFPAHFQWWNPTGCANMQMNEAINPSLCARWCARLSACLQLMIIGPLTVLSTFLSTVLCCLCMYTSLRRELQDGTNRAANHYQRRANVTAHRSILLQPAEDFTEQFRARNQNCFTKWYFSPFQIAFRAQLSTCMSSWGMFWMFLLFALPLGLSGGSVVLALLIVVGLVVYPFYAASRLYQREYPWPDFVTQGCISTWRRVKRCFSCCCHYHALNRECRICCFICRPIHPPTDNQPTADGARSRQLSYRAPASYSRTHDANHNPDVDIELGMTKTTEAEESVHVTNDYETMQSRLDRMLRTLQDMENTLDRSEQQKKHLPLSQEDESDAEVNCKSENGEEVIVKQPQDADNNSSNSMFGLDHNPYSDQSSLSISNQELLRDLSEESTTFHDIQNALSTLLNEMMEAQV